MRHTLGPAALCALIAASPTARLEASTTDGLIGHWALDGGNANTAPDSSGRGQDGRIEGAQRAEGVRGDALSFDGRSSFVTLGDLGEHSSVTVAFWFKAANIRADHDWQGLVTSDAWDEGVFHIPVRNSVVDVYLHKGGSRRGRLTSPRLQDGVWYQMKCSRP